MFSYNFNTEDLSNTTTWTKDHGMVAHPEKTAVKYRIILFNASIKPILEYCVAVWGNCNTGLLDDTFKVQKRCARIILDAPFQARTLRYFLNLDGYLSTIYVLKGDYVCLKHSWMEVHRIT